MRLLYITNGFPFPLTSGYLRHYFLLRELSARHQVTLLSLAGPEFEPAHAAALEPYTVRVEAFGGRRLSLPGKVRRRVRTLAVGSADGPVAAMRDVAATLVLDGAVDAAVFSGKGTFPVLAALGDLPVVVDLCDATSSRLRGGIRYEEPRRIPAVLLEYASVRQVERKLVLRGDQLLFASARDRDALLGGPAPRAVVVPNGVDLDAWTRTTPELGRDEVVFTGKMSFPPNEHAAHHLATEVMPLVRETVPTAHLSIVGRDPTPRLRRIEGAPGVTVTGFVPDVRPYLERASVFAAPLHFGAGIQNKVLEAMAMAVPVVASSVAAAGLRTGDGVEPPVTVADDPATTAAAVVERLRAAADGAPPDHAGRRYVEDHFVWRGSAALVERALGAAVDRTASPSREG